MATLTLISKVHLGSGNFEYTYKCECNNSTNEIKVTSGNDMQAEMLAQMECDDNCNNSKLSKSQTNDLKKILIESGKPFENSFIVAIEEIQEENYFISLCTGDKINIPKKIVKSFDLIGGIESNNKLFQLGKLTFKTDNNEGLLIQELSNIIEKMTSNPDDNLFNYYVKNGEEHLQIKVLCSGTVCNPVHSYFTSSKPIIQHSLRRAENCRVSNVTKLGSNRLRILHSALAGVCGTYYSGRAYFDIVVRTE